MKYHKLLPYAMSGLSGILMAIAFTWQPLQWLCFAALIPLFLALSSCATYRRAARCMLVYGMIYHILLLQWLYQLSPLTQVGLDQIASVLVLSAAILGIALVESALLAIPAACVSWHKRGGWRDIIRFGLFYILGEALQERAGALAFPWGRLGAVCTATPWIQSASLLGSLFLSVCVVWVNGFLARALQSMAHRPKALISVGLAAGILGGNLLCGALLLDRAPSGGRRVEVALVQGNLDGLNKWELSVEQAISYYIDMSRRALGENTRWVVWNETSVLGDLYADADLCRPITDFAEQYGITVFAGMVYQPPAGELLQNALTVVDAGGIAQPYCKQRLVPFGEAIPCAAFLQKWWPQLQVNLLPGNECTVLPTAQGNTAALICYESIFPQIARENVRAGGEIIVMVTNDSWFGDSAALRQHLSHARLRAVETGRWVVHAANTGISCFISPAGQVSGELPVAVAASSRQVVTLSEHRTLYSRWGDVILLPGILLFFWDAWKILRAKAAGYGKIRIWHGLQPIGGIRYVFSGNRGRGNGAKPLLRLPRMSKRPGAKRSPAQTQRDAAKPADHV